MSDWQQRLAGELDEWNFEGEEATFWWRDDDATSMTPALERLVTLTARREVPLALAIIPSQLDGSLIRDLESRPMVHVLQHGYDHCNHAPESEKKAEFGAHRATGDQVAELITGRERLAAAFAGRFLPILVPPWNRIAPSTVEALPGAGFTGVSTYTPRSTREPCDGLWQVNTHVDIIGWKQGKCFTGADTAADLMISHLERRRRGECDSGEPTGLLTHHLDHDEAAWAFLADLVELMDNHPAVRWVDADKAFMLQWRD